MVPLYMDKKQDLAIPAVTTIRWEVDMRVFQLVLFVAVAALTGCGLGNRVDVPSEAIIRLSDQFTSDFSLIDANGRKTSSQDLKGKTLVVYFGFATCPDVCPLALGTLSAALSELSPGQLSRIQPVFITVDPERRSARDIKSLFIRLSWIDYGPDRQFGNHRAGAAVV